MTLNSNPRVWIFLFIITLLLTGVISVAWKFSNVTKYIAISLVLILFINPFITKLEIRGVKRNRALMGTLVITFLVLFGWAQYAIPNINTEITNIVNDWPQIQERINDDILREEMRDGELFYYSPLFDIEINPQTIEDAQKTITDTFASAASSFASFLFSMILIVPFLSYIMISEGREIKKYFIRLLPNKSFEVILAIISNVAISFQNYIYSKGIQAIIVAFICFIGFIIIDLPLPLILALIVGLLNIVPYIGPFLGAIPPLLLAYITLGNEGMVLTIGVIGVAQIVDNLFTQPVLLPKLINEHAFIVIVVTLLGAEIFGPVGFLIGVPLFFMYKIVLQNSYYALDAVYKQ